MTESKTNTTPYDVAEHLRTPEEMAAYLEASIEEANGDTAFIAKALRDITRAKLQAEIDALAALPDDQIQTDDIPEVRDWSSAKRGVLYRPVKQQITLRLDADLIEWFKAHHSQDEGYQTRINRALCEYISQQTA